MSSATLSLRVHILIDSLSWGGAEMLLSDLAAGAPSAGIDLSVGYLIDSDGNPAAAGLRRYGVEPELVPVHGILKPNGVMRVRRHLARVRPDVVHTHLALADAVGTLAARSLGLPSLSTIHVVAGQPTGRPSDQGLRGVARARLVALVRRRAGECVIAVSDAARDAYLATGWDTPERVLTVHNGIASEPRDREGTKVRAELGLEPDALVVSIVAVLRPGKGHDVVIEAVRRLLPRFPSLRLLVVGDGPAREEIRGLLEPLGAAAILAGHRDDVMSVLAATDVLVHPTLRDAFPTALLEAAAARVPMLASAVGGIPEIVQDGVTGLLLPFPPTPDAVEERLGSLLVDEALGHRLSQGAYERFQACFTAEHWAARLRLVYDQAIAQVEVRSGGRRRGARA